MTTVGEQEYRDLLVETIARLQSNINSLDSWLHAFDEMASESKLVLKPAIDAKLARIMMAAEELRRAS